MINKLTEGFSSLVGEANGVFICLKDGALLVGFCGDMVVRVNVEIHFKLSL